MEITVKVTAAAIRSDPVGLAVNPRADTLYVAQRNGKVQLISGATNKITAQLRVSTYTAGAVVIPRTGAAYVTDESADTVSVLRPCRRHPAA